MKAVKQVAARALALTLAALAVLSLPASRADDSTEAPRTAYFKEKDAQWDVKTPIEQNKDRDWMFLQFPEYTGNKPRIAVMTAGNQQPGTNYWEWTDGVNSYKVPISEYNTNLGAPVADIQEFVSSAFQNTHRYRLYERVQMGDVQKEQTLGMEGTTSKESAPSAGKITGVQYIIESAVTEWKADVSKNEGVAGRLGMSSLMGAGWGKSKAEVAMSFKVIDATTSEVVDSRIVRATCDNWKISPGALLFGSSSIIGGLAHIEKNSPASYAVQSCVNKAVYQIVGTLKAQPWSGVIMDATDDGIFVNAGVDAGLKSGMELVAIQKGKDMTNPETGKVIHTRGKELGTLEITEVTDEYAIARPKDGCKVSKGDKVRIKN